MAPTRRDHDTEWRAWDWDRLVAQAYVQLVLAANADRIVNLMRLDELAVRVQAAGLDAAKRKADPLRVRRELILEDALILLLLGELLQTLLPLLLCGLLTRNRRGDALIDRLPTRPCRHVQLPLARAQQRPRRHQLVARLLDGHPSERHLLPELARRLARRAEPHLLGRRVPPDGTLRVDRAPRLEHAALVLRGVRLLALLERYARADVLTAAVLNL